MSDLKTTEGVLEWVESAVETEERGYGFTAYRVHVFAHDTETAAWLAECVRIAEIVRREAIESLPVAGTVSRAILAEAKKETSDE